MLLIALILLFIGLMFLGAAYEEYEKETTVIMGNTIVYLENHVGFWKWMFGKDED